MIVEVHVPGPRYKRGDDPRFRPHVLVITDPGDGGEKEWEIEHHEDCPRVCDWWPERGWSDMFGYDPEFRSPREIAADPLTGPEWRHDCFVEWEIANNGLASLEIWSDVRSRIDPGYVPATRFEEDWHRLRPGRYVIEGWYRAPYGYLADADGGLVIVEGVAAWHGTVASV